MEYRIGLIHGDGIGPEIVDEAKKVLDAVCEKYGHKFEYTNLLLGGASIDVHGVPLTDETIEEAKKCDAVLMGSIGGDAKTALAASGIKLFGGVSGDADEAVEAFINKTLDYNPDVKCSHHEHSHGEGHTCGEHGCGSHSCH